MTLEQFLLNLFFAALSAFLGVQMGVWYAKHDHANIQASEKQELRRKLIKAFQFNLKRLKQMSDQLTSKQIDIINIPDYCLDTESVSHILFHGRNLFDDETWFDKFNWQRFQLVHINEQVDFLNNITNLSSISLGSISSQDGVGQQRYDSLVGHLMTTQKEISALISDYEKVA